MAQVRTKVDVANRALQRLGVAKIASFQDANRQANEISTCYEILRRAELRTAPWRFATRRVALRNLLGATTPVTVTFPTWASGTTYANAFVVLGSDNQLYQSQKGSNTGNDPTLDDGTNWVYYVGTTTATAWSSTTSYYGGELVTNAGTVYLSLQNANLNSSPPTSQWCTLTGATTAAYVFTDATGYGRKAAQTKGIFLLPYGYLRMAPQDQKAAGAAVTGTSSGVRYLDWEFEGNYLMSSDPDPVLFRFVADINLVPSFEPLFSESLSARIGFEIVEILTQDPTKEQLIGTIYQRYSERAKLYNRIEIGTTEDEDEAFDPLFQLVGPKPPVPQGRQ